MKRKYRVVFVPEAGAWNASIPEVAGCLTWGRSLSAARRYIREALEVSLEGVSPKEAARIAASAILEEDIRMPPAVKRVLSRQKEAQARSEADAARLAKLTEEAAVALTRDAGLSLRDAGELLNLSHARVDQLLKAG